MAAFLDHETSNFSSLLTTPASKLSHLLYPTILISILLPAYRFILKDYHAFLALGPGGTPSTFAGYLRVTYLRLFTISDPFQPPSLAQPTCPQGSYLQLLPPRSGPRPVTAGIAPHRQLNQKPSLDLHYAVRKGLHSLVAACPSMLRKGNSCFEKNGLALFLSAGLNSNPPETAPPETAYHPTPSHLNPTCQDTGEICHLHATDSSMHLTLHPLDAALVIASGWGERHPLAGCSIHGKRLLPPGFVMVYAPREESEVATVMEIVKAGGWWVGGVDLGKSS